jgi:hypothetical protein
MIPLIRIWQTPSVNLMTVSNKNSGKRISDRGASMNLTPVRNCQITEERSGDDMVIIRYPITLKPWIASLLTRFGHSTNENRFKKLQLDDLGAEVWGLIDDARSVRQITRIFADTHRIPLRESEIAITQFLRDLGQRGIIGLR